MLPNAKMLGNLCWHEGEVLSKRRWEGKTCGIASRARDGLWNIRFNIHAIINVIALNTSRESMSSSSFVTTRSPP
eukprot:scaffold1892_cov79-Skeletonema_marinoi.AAC.1